MSGGCQKALDLLNVMRSKGMRINLITYNAAITALSKAAKQQAKSNRSYPTEDPTGEDQEESLWAYTELLLDQMKDEGIQPDGFSYSSAIACCGAEGRWQEALELMEAMSRGGPKCRPNKIAYTAAICECRYSP